MKKFVEVSQLHVGSHVYNEPFSEVPVRVYLHLRRRIFPGCDVVELGLAGIGCFACHPTERILIDVPEAEEEAAAAQWHEDLLKMSSGIQQLLGKPRNREDLAAIAKQIEELALTYGHPVLRAWKR